MRLTPTGDRDRAGAVRAAVEHRLHRRPLWAALYRAADVPGRAHGVCGRRSWPRSRSSAARDSPNAHEVGHSLVAGSLVHGLYLGGVFTAISQGVPAGISALIPGLQPILTSTIANRFMGETVTRMQWLGLVLGLVGVVLVLHDRNIVLAGSHARLDCKFCLAHRHHARHALPEALLRRHRLARWQSRAIYRRGRAVRPRRLRIRDARDPLERRAHFRPRLAGAGAVDRGGRADVLADPPLGGDRLRQPVLSGAGGDGVVRLSSCSASGSTRCRLSAW